MRIIHIYDAPKLIIRLDMPDHKARVERGIVFTIEAIEWNCLQHIKPGYSEVELDHISHPLLEENKQVREQLFSLQEN